MLTIVQGSFLRVKTNSDGFSLYDGGLKRLVDIALVLASLPLTVPLIAALWLWVRIDGGPGLFRQARIGRNGQVFQCLKLRTMRVDAAEALARHLAHSPEAAAEWKHTRKLLRDPRITRAGRLLRRSSLDELPQLWNVLRGDMSLVGPRPVLREELTLYGTSLPDYLAGRPGLTGLWQVSGRNGLNYDARVRLDALYRRTLSLRLDTVIILRTFGALFRGTGC